VRLTRTGLDILYDRTNRQELIHPDPLEFLSDYPELPDRELAGFIAASLAFGRVAQILNRLTVVFGLMGPSPRRFIDSASDDCLRDLFGTFRHRFVDGPAFVCFLKGIRRLLERHGSLESVFRDGQSVQDETVIPGLVHLFRELGVKGSYLVPDPSAGAAKRLHLFMRWMVRSDAVDPGGWRGVSPARLVVPLDTHMAHVGRRYRLTRRRTAGLGMALDITRAFRKLNPDDPVRYDFSLTRFGIRGELDWPDLDRLMVCP